MRASCTTPLGVPVTVEVHTIGTTRIGPAILPPEARVGPCVLISVHCPFSEEEKPTCSVNKCMDKTFVFVVSTNPSGLTTGTIKNPWVFNRVVT